MLALQRSICVPVDNRLRIAVVVPDHETPHNHINAAHDQGCEVCLPHVYQQTGVPAATTKKVDNCMLSILND
jgi:hypothetical protein